MDNLSDSSGRVTRSLKKRIASVDSNSSSRPGTPIQSKVTIITKMSASPSRPTRITRRNSTSGTPAKRGILIPENVETVTPVRRNTRRHSLSINENEVSLQTGLKVPSFATLAEENVFCDKESTNNLTMKITRSQSKSPSVGSFESPSKSITANPKKNSDAEKQNINTNIRKRRKPGPKCKTRQSEQVDDLSDVEIIVFENEKEQTEIKSSDITTIDLSNEEPDELNNITIDKTAQKKYAEDALEKIKMYKLDTSKPIDNVTANNTEIKDELVDIRANDEEIGENTTKTVETVDNCLDKINVISTSCLIINESLCALQETTTKHFSEIKESKSFNCDENEKDECFIQPRKKEAITNIINDNGMSGDIINDVKLQQQESKSLTSQVDKSLNEATVNAIENEQTENVIPYKTLELQQQETKSSTSQVDKFLNDATENAIENEQTENVIPYKTLESEEQLRDKKIKIISVGTLTTNQTTENQNLNVDDCKISKKVNFNSSPSVEKSLKNIYPKTPVFMKTKSFIENESPLDKSNINNSNNILRSEITNLKKIQECQMEISNRESKTPISVLRTAQQINIVQSSTPINIELSKYAQLTGVEEFINKSAQQLERPLNESENILKEENEQNQMPGLVENLNRDYSANEITCEKDDGVPKWINPSVKGVSEDGTKLDAVVQNCYENIATENEIEVNKMENSKATSLIFTSEDDIEKSDYEETKADEKKDEEGEECEIETEEQPYVRQHDFHDDEAMEVNDYESGDSMDSEERQEMMENEIPIDGESIGSHTTEEEYEQLTEEEYSENADSFIVSDNEDNEWSESNGEDKQVDDKNEHNKKKKIYKRLLQPIHHSSSSEEDTDIDKLKRKQRLESSEKENDKLINYNVNEEKSKTILKRSKKEDEKPINENILELNYEPNIESITKKSYSLNNNCENILDSSKLSDSALRLHCTAETDREEIEEESMNLSRKKILQKLNKSDRFNKSVRDLNLETDTSPVEIEHENKIEMHVVAAFSSNGNAKNVYEKKEECDKENVECLDDENMSSVSSEDIVHLNEGTKHSRSLLGEVSVTSESEDNKENKHVQKFLIDKKPENGLSVSFGSYNMPKNNSKERREWQRSFTVGVCVNNGNLDTEVIENKTEDLLSSSDADYKENQEIDSENIKCLENNRHIPLPLGNPLIRTRRQSLALPTNPDMEICSSSQDNETRRKAKRKSLGILSINEFNPSQSFIDSVELRKSELDRQSVKRKRLSKSFCGASEAFENSIVDIDVCHLHKRSKLNSDKSLVENYHNSTENMNYSKLLTKVSSTPLEKVDKNASNNNFERILSRCDEILEASNLAKLEAKISCKRNKAKNVKSKEKVPSVSQEINRNDVLRKVSKLTKRKGQRKSALTQEIGLGKTKRKQIKVGEHLLNSKRLPSDVLEAIKESVPLIKKNTKEVRNDQEKPRHCQTTSTAAGNFMETPQTPERKTKRVTYIKLPTGKVSVEPVTPKKHSVLACNGTEFRESPITPFPTGFKVRQIPLVSKNTLALISKNGKRKRLNDEPKKILLKPQWTLSGPFIEEEIPTMRQVIRSDDASQMSVSRKAKNISTGKDPNVIWNFKQHAMMRTDIKRGTNRKIILLKERRKVQSHY